MTCDRAEGAAAELRAAEVRIERGREALQLQRHQREAAARLRAQAQSEREQARQGDEHARRRHTRWADIYEARAAALEEGNTR